MFNRLLPSLVCFAAAGFASAVLSAERNIVLIVADDQSPDLGCYGNNAIVTPNLDALANEGTRFTHAFATTASCSASRSVILSGLHNHANGQYGHQHNYHKFASFQNVRSLPVLLAEQGYRTAQIGKYHVAPEEVYRFETYLRGNGRNAVQMAENCEEFLRAKDDRPFFLYFATSDPHRGGGKDQNSSLTHKPDLFGNRPDNGSHSGVEEVFYDPKDVWVPPFLPNTPECRAEIAQYYQSVSRVDQGVGRLMDILKDSGQWENTLFIYTADHGMAFPGAKTTVYEAGLKVPFLARNPYAKDAVPVSDAMLSFVDITPTLLDFAGGLKTENGKALIPAMKQAIPNERFENRGPVREAFHGRSFLPAFTEQSPRGWDQINASHTFHEIQMYYPMRVVRDREYKLIWNIAHPLPFPFASDLWAASTWQGQYEKGLDAPYGQRTVESYIHRPEFELFHIAKDPYESRNLAYEKDYQQVLKTYQEKLRQFQKDTDDPWILKWEYE